MRASPRTIRTEARRGEWRRGPGSPRSRYFWFDSRSVSDGWAICKALASAGATIIVGTWPPVLGIFQKSLAAGKFDEDSTLEDGSKLKIEKIYPLDAVFDTRDDVPDDVMGNKRYAGLSGFTIQECADAVAKDYGKIDIFVHSLANGPEVAKPLLETSRTGYIAAMSASSYSLISCVQRFAPIMNEGGSFLSLGFIAANLVVPGYGGGMSSAKAQLESDTRVLAWEAGRNYGVRVNCISAGPLKSRAASAIQKGDKRTFIEVSAHPPRSLPRFPSPLRPAAQLCRRPLEYRPSIGLCLALSPLSPASLEAPCLTAAPSRAAPSQVGIDYYLANAPLQKNLYSDDIGSVACSLCSPAFGAVTGVTLYVDNGMHAMGWACEQAAEKLWARAEPLEESELMGAKYTSQDNVS